MNCNDNNFKKIEYKDNEKLNTIHWFLKTETLNLENNINNTVENDIIDITIEELIISDNNKNLMKKSSVSDNSKNLKNIINIAENSVNTDILLSRDTESEMKTHTI